MTPPTTSDAATDRHRRRVSFASPTLTWTGNLAPGATATITFSVTVNNPDTGDHILASTVTSATAGQQLPGRQHRPAVLRDGDRWRS